MMSTIRENMKSTITLRFNVMKAKNAKIPLLLLAHFCNENFIIKYRTVPDIRSIPAIPLPYPPFPRLAAPAKEIGPLVVAVLLVVW